MSHLQTECNGASDPVHIKHSISHAVLCVVDRSILIIVSLFHWIRYFVEEVMRILA
jgi:hypothetical protein